jgi:hypothetical protein
MQPRFGGSFAPPLTPDTLNAYVDLAESASPQVREAMRALINTVSQFHALPKRAAAPGTPHPSGRGTVEPLHPDDVARLDPHVPWKEELQMYGDLFEGISNETHKPLRDAAFHLLWYGVELFADRRPITNDRL